MLASREEDDGYKNVVNRIARNKGRILAAGRITEVQGWGYEKMKPYKKPAE